jgi:hypothetical protein
MATIELIPDNVQAGQWLILWAEKDEVIGRVVQDSTGCCQINPLGPHWSPMKSFAALSCSGPDEALAEVNLYFRGR